MNDSTFSRCEYTTVGRQAAVLLQLIRDVISVAQTAKSTRGQREFVFDILDRL